MIILISGVSQAVQCLGWRPQDQARDRPDQAGGQLRELRRQVQRGKRRVHIYKSMCVCMYDNW